MAAKRCLECNTTMYSDFGAIYCNVCHQARESRRHSERQAREAQYAAESAAREAARVQAYHTQVLINAENERIAAINHQTQVIAESVITPKAAYDRGFRYLDNELKSGNPAGAELVVGEDGLVGAKWNHIYIIPTLREEFRRGVSDRLQQTSCIYETLKASAKQAGKQNAEETLAPRFTLYTGLKIGGADVKTRTFDSKFRTWVDEKTGEKAMRWNEPFDSAELNKAYQDGASEVYWAENTEEKKNYRLRFEVPELIAAREQTKAIKRLDKVFKGLRYALPLLVLYILWQILTGWTFLFSLIGVYLLYGSLEWLHEQWQIKNNDQLRKE